MRKRKALSEPLSTLRQVRAIVPDETVITVDPGSEGTGWAIWKFTEPLLHTGTHNSIPFGVLNSRAPAWQDRLHGITARLCTEVLLRYRPDRMLLEWPALWSGSAKSHAATASGKLIKLAALCGAIELSAIRICPRKSLFVLPSEWKGQLSKPAVNARIMRAIGKAYPNHASDAVGMGLAVLGLL